MIRGMLVLLVATCLGELLRQVLQVRISGPVLGMALLVVTTTIYILGRDRMRTTSQGFSSAPP